MTLPNGLPERQTFRNSQGYPLEADWGSTERLSGALLLTRLDVFSDGKTLVLYFKTVDGYEVEAVATLHERRA